MVRGLVDEKLDRWLAEASGTLYEPVRSTDRWNRFCEPSLLEVEPPEIFMALLSTPDLLLERSVLRRGIARPASEDGARR